MTTCLHALFCKNAPWDWIEQCASSTAFAEVKEALTNAPCQADFTPPDLDLPFAIEVIVDACQIGDVVVLMQDGKPVPVAFAGR